MGIEVYGLIDAAGEDAGAILVCNTSGRVLNLPIGTFDEEEQAEDFLRWCYDGTTGEPRKLSDEELEAAVASWRVDAELRAVNETMERADDEENIL